MADAKRLIANARREESDVSERFVWGAFGLLVVSLVATVLLVLWLYPNSLLDRTISLPLPAYPAPRLQASPRADMQTFYAQEMRRLNSVGWIDKAHGVVHIPISDAMRLVARDGDKTWPTKPGSPQP